MSRLLPLVLLLLAAGCTEETFDAYQTRGEVVALKPEMDAVTLFHEDVPGFMDSMQMDFSLASVEDMTGLTPGDKVSFTIAVSQKDGATIVRDIVKLPETTRLDLDKPLPPALPDSLMLDSLRADSADMSTQQMIEL